MTTLTKEQVLDLARESDIDYHKLWNDDDTNRLERYATLCRADLVAENERHIQEVDASRWRIDTLEDALRTIAGTTDGTDCNAVARAALGEKP